MFINYRSVHVLKVYKVKLVWKKTAPFNGDKQYMIWLRRKIKNNKPIIMIKLWTINQQAVEIKAKPPLKSPKNKWNKSRPGCGGTIPVPGLIPVVNIVNITPISLSDLKKQYFIIMIILIHTKSKSWFWKCCQQIRLFSQN